MNRIRMPGDQAIGLSLQLFGTLLLVASLVASYYLGILLVDLLTLVVIALGSSIKDSSRRAMKWALALMIYYVLMALTMGIAAAVQPLQIKVGSRSIPPQALPLVMLALAVMGVWAALNAAALGVRLRSPAA